MYNAIKYLKVLVLTFTVLADPAAVNTGFRKGLIAGFYLAD